MADSTVKFAGADRAASGDWDKITGRDGYQIAGGATKLPAGATVAFAGADGRVWTDQLAGDRGLKKPDGAAGRTGAYWFAADGKSFAVEIAVPAATTVSFYFMDFDNPAGGRAQRVEALDAAGAVVDSQPVEAFAWGAYLSYAVTGTVKFRVVSTNPAANAVLNGIFFGAVAAPARPASGVMVTDFTAGWGRYALADLAETAPGDFVHRGTPESVDLSPTMPAFKSQRGADTSAAMAVAALLQSYDPTVAPSALFVHYNATVLDGRGGQKVNPTNAAACMAAAEFGYCDESDWPYDPAKIGVKPPPDAYAKAAARKIAKKRVAYLHNNADHLFGCLAAGQPFLAGFVVTARALDSFVTATGAVPPVDWTEAPAKLGWVCVLATGYERVGVVGTGDLKGAVRFRTGWADAAGRPWGDGGYGSVKLSHLCGSTAGGLVTILKP